MLGRLDRGRWALGCGRRDGARGSVGCWTAELWLDQAMSRAALSVWRVVAWRVLRRCASLTRRRRRIRTWRWSSRLASRSPCPARRESSRGGTQIGRFRSSSHRAGGVADGESKNHGRGRATEQPGHGGRWSSLQATRRVDRVISERGLARRGGAREEPVGGEPEGLLGVLEEAAVDVGGGKG